jgi:dipeptidyl aminopeptidase/acylaminoacyl peptidase
MMTDLKQRFGALDTLEFPHPENPPSRSEARVSQDVPRYTRGRGPVAIFALLVAAAGIGFAVDAFREGPEVREPGPPGGTGTIAYVAFDGQTSKWSLFTVEADGSPATRIAIDLPGEAFHPSWSPDGTKLAFDVQSEGDTEIHAMTVYGSNGSNLSKLTATAGWNFLPAWSPDGSRIAYVHTSGANHDIWIMNADGSNPVRLTHDPDFDLDPTWSPDGSRLAFESNRTGGPEIYVMNADGSHVSRLTNSPGSDGSPAWSPDGRQIAFVSDRDGPGIYLMASDGSDVRKVVDGEQDGPIDPEWSPDGARLAYSSSPGAEMGTAIYVIDLVSGHTRSLTDLGDLCCPSWRPRPEQVTGVAMPGTCDYGPWIEHCPEASWARLVLREADYPNVDDTGAVFEVPVPRSPGTFYFWAMDPFNHGSVEPIGEIVSELDIPVAARIGGVAVYQVDDAWLWSTHGLNVWVRSANPADDPPELSLATVRQLLIASQHVPYPE